MRTGLFALAVVLLGSAATPAADPPIVFQAQPVGQVLDQMRYAADLVGGEKGVKAVNKRLKEAFGEKGLDGLDLGRPVVGYVVLAPKPEDITAVVALPITSEKDFLELCDRANLDKHRVDPKDKTLYHLPPLNPQYKAMMRFSEQYAYIAYGFNPAPHIEAKSLVPMAKLYDPADRGLISARVHFDRIPAAVKLSAGVLMEEVKKTILEGLRLRGPQEDLLIKAAMPEIEKLLLRYLLLASGADTLAARIYFDQVAEGFVAEAVLTPKPDSELAKIVAAYKTAPNRFGAVLNHPDTVAAVATRAPLFAPEVRSAVSGALDAVGKEAVKREREVDRVWMDELYKGLVRTAKNMDWDVALALRGPNKDGWFHVVGATALDDATKLEKELIAAWKKQAPKEEQERMKWNADKQGNVNIHTYHWRTGGFFDFTKFLGGETCYGAFAFGPDAVIGAVGPDSVAVIKEVLSAKPTPAKAMEMVANPGKVVKVFEKAGGANDTKAAEIMQLIGKTDKLTSSMSIVVEGGKELRATFTMNLRQLPRLMFADAIEHANRDPVKPPPPFDKIDKK